MASTVIPQHNKSIIIISGPSGVGKGTLIEKLKATHPKTFAATTSHTTRKPRPGEVENETYFYVSREEFRDLIARNAFVEHAEFSGQLYGTSKQTIVDKTAEGLIVLLDIDMQGVKSIKADPSLNTRAHYVFIKPPSWEQLEARLRGRGTDTEESIQKRLRQAKVELDYADTGAHDAVIVNDDLQQAYEELDRFIFT